MINTEIHDEETTCAQCLTYIGYTGEHFDGRLLCDYCAREHLELANADLTPEDNK